jgi:hypothetical protein
MEIHKRHQKGSKIGTFWHQIGTKYRVHYNVRGSGRDITVQAESSSEARRTVMSMFGMSWVVTGVSRVKLARCVPSDNQYARTIYRFPTISFMNSIPRACNGPKWLYSA